MTESSRSIERVFRDEYGRVLAGLISVVRDFDLAEEVLQDAFAVALERWPVEGIPSRPGAWITTVARNRALDRVRRSKVFEHKAEALRGLAELEPAHHASPDDADDTMATFPDDRLRLIFTCCHPYLASEARVALTLRLLGGLTTGEIARAFLVAESTMAQRLVRAKRKIKGANIPYRVPPRELLAERLGSVLAVVYLIFNEGYAATEGDDWVRGELCEESLRLASLLAQLMPDEPEVHGLFALLLLHDSRREARSGPGGALVVLEHQDRGRWDPERVQAGIEALRYGLRQKRIGPYQLQAAISAEHAIARSWEGTNWTGIVGLYDTLLLHVDSPMVALNRLVGVAMLGRADEALSGVDELSEALAEHYKWSVVRGWMLARLGRRGDAALAYQRAIEGCSNGAEQTYLRGQLRSLSADA